MYSVNIHSIQPSSYVDGPGKRAVVFFRGCTLGCPGCQNRLLWPQSGGFSIPVDALAHYLSRLAEPHGAVTISGGEPFQQPAALGELVERLRFYGISNLIVYTGYTWEELFDPRVLSGTNHPAFPFLKDILPWVNVLVDGRFDLHLDDPLIAYRGSRNQRPIDVQMSLRAGRPIVLDWDSPEIVLAPSGDVYLPSGLAPEFTETGAVNPTRRCGETS